MILSLASNFRSHRRAGAAVLIALAVVGYGCGSSQQQTTDNGAARSPKNSLKAEDLYRWEGEGSAKRKVYLTRQEQKKLLYERAKKAE